MVYQREKSDDDFEQGATDFEQMLEESLGQKRKVLKVGDRVKSEVLSVGREHVIVSTGTPHDGFVARNELLDAKAEPLVKVGDTLDLFVTQVRGTEIFLSPKPSSKSLSDDLEQAFHAGLTVEGRVEEVVNGGFKVNVLGKRAFCPISQLDSRRIDVPEEYVGKKFDFKISQYSERGRNIVVSRRKILDEIKQQSEITFFETHIVGSVVSGTVSRLEKFGAFVELAPGIDGLVHVSELSWSRVSDPKDAVEIGQLVNAKILKIESDGNRKKISLSIKQNQSEPWTQLPESIKDGAVVSGKVTRCLKFGAFVEIAPGIEGLIPLSEMSFTKRVARSDELVKEGEIIQVKIKELDAFARRISLSLREAEGQDPWASVNEGIKLGSIVSGTVERREAFGLFVSIGDGVTGLLPKSRGLESKDFGYDRLKPGDVVQVRVAEIRASDRKIALDVPSNDSGTDDWNAFKAEQSAKKLDSAGASPMGALGAQLKAAMDRKGQEPTKSSKKS